LHGSPSPTTRTDFLAGGGEMGALMRTHAWSTTPLGRIEAWPQSLKTMVAFILRSPLAMALLWGEEGVMLYNDAYAAIAGGRHPDLLGAKVREAWPEVADFDNNVMRVVLAGGTLSFRDQEMILHRHGQPEQLFMDLDYSPVLGESGKPAGVFAIVIETTERVRAERRNVSERELLLDVFDATGAFIQVIDPDYNLLAINKANAEEYERVYGLSPVAGDNLLDLLASFPEQRDVACAHFARALAGETFTVTGEFGDPARGPRWYEIKFSPLWGARGELTGAYHFSLDVTERRREQERLAQAEEALRQAQKMEAVGQLTGGVAHDFNNLLTIIKSSTDLLRRPDLAEERRRRYVDAISDTVDRAARLTGQLLAFARRQALKPEVFDASERIGAVTEMLRTIMGSRVQILTEFPDERCWVGADLVQFETALVNMAVNARDAMEGEGTLTVRVEAVSQVPPLRGHGASSGPFVAISLTDTGSGIASDKLAQIFEPFYTTKDVGKGTGLGLSQVYGFAKQSGGDVGVASGIGHGTTFTLYLPRVARPGGEAQEDEPHRHVQHDTGGGRRVLVVEDNAEVGRFSTQLLQDLGYETTWAANADEALKLLGEVNGFDAVFSDVVMPGMSGVELGQEIRRRYPGLPVVLTSGYSHVLAEDGRHGFELLQKPYAIEELSRVLRCVTRAGQSRGSVS
jgi:PAS domain S-box-containing protein